VPECYRLREFRRREANHRTRSSRLTTRIWRCGHPPYCCCLALRFWHQRGCIVLFSSQDELNALMASDRRSVLSVACFLL
jgi:hypothetical protein